MEFPDRQGAQEQLEPAGPEEQDALTTMTTVPKLLRAEEGTREHCCEDSSQGGQWKEKTRYGFLPLPSY